MLFIYFIAFIVLGATPAFSNPNCASSSSNPLHYEQIDHAHFLANDISNLYLNERYSDVVLVVDNERLHAHRIVLASRSDYFRVLLYGEHKESREMDVPIREASATSFKVLLEYTYSGRMNLSILESNDILEILKLSVFFGFSNLQFSLVEYLRSNISVHNVCSLLAVACLYELKELEDESLDFIDIHALDVLKSEDSLSLSPEEFHRVLNRDTAHANELDIFRAACRWIKMNQNRLSADTITQILSAVRYQLMVDEELSEVRRSELVRSDRIILDIIKSRIDSFTHALDYRGQLEPDVNFVQRAPNKLSKIGGVTMITLDHPSNINYIEMKLWGIWDLDSITYSYYIEVSMDQQYWLRVIDHSNYDCRSIQRLWIHRRFVRYVRIVGTKNNVKWFEFLKIMYKTDNMNLIEIKNGLVAPKYNVALSSMSAIVIQGESKSWCYNFLDGHYKYCDMEYVCTYHLLESGAIKVQLGQPYVLGSLRLLLWDCDSRTYGYTIEVSVDNMNWDLIVDKSDESCRSWQLLQFESRPIVYIRIIGVHTSKNDELFKLVHLEAPAQVALDSNIASKQRRSMLRLFSRK